MQLKSPSLFWQLYLGILIAMLGISFLFLVLYAYLSYSTDPRDFYRDIKPVINTVTHAPEQSFSPGLLHAIREEFMFDIKFLSEQQWRELEPELIHRARFNGTDIFEFDDGLMAVRPYAQGQFRYLLIQDFMLDPEQEHLTDEMRFEFEQELEDDNRFDNVLKAAIITMLIAIAALLMFLVRRINRHMQHFSDVCKVWGMRQFSVRANELAPAPIGELAVNLNGMAEALQKADEEKQVMMHAVSHELRTPLSSLQLALGLMERKHPELVDEPLLTDIQQYADQLHTLVTASLTLAKVSHGQLEFDLEKLDICRLLKERAEFLQKSSPDIRLEYKPFPAVVIQGNSFNLQMALDNVLSNAFKYTHSVLRLRVSVEQQKLSICIEDDGPGVPASVWPQLLLPFSRGDKSRNRDSGGFGLGLAITHTIISKHGGQIRFYQPQGTGLGVELILPV